MAESECEVSKFLQALKKIRNIWERVGFERNPKDIFPVTDWSPSSENRIQGFGISAMDSIGGCVGRLPAAWKETYCF
jgi:hypothetical protein